ncbi:MAG: hypothetical protein MJZ68_01525 [archaeon]|nr:hypothetical protein [archaeon]
MTVNVTYDEEVDRLLSVRQASRIPLPPEIAFLDQYAARRFFSRRCYYGLMGVGNHPLVRYLEESDIRTAMASAVSKAPYLDRMAHYDSWRGDSAVKVIIARNGEETVVDLSDRTPPSSPGPPPPLSPCRRQAAPQ